MAYRSGYIPASKKPSFFAVIALLTIMFTAGIVPISDVGAATWDNRSEKNAYFSNNRYWSLTCRPGSDGDCTGEELASNNYVMPGNYGGLAFPEDLDTVDELVAFLKAKTDKKSDTFNDRWAKNGAAFIVHSMLGRTGEQAMANGGRNVKAADYELIRAHLRGAKINWFQENVSTDGVNTISVYGGGEFDVARYYQTKLDRAIVIKDQNDKTVYKLFRRCANPIGAMDRSITEIPKIADYALYPKVNFADGPQQKTAPEGTQVAIDSLVANEGPDDSPPETINHVPYTLYRYTTRAGEPGVDVDDTAIFNRTQSINPGGVTIRYAQVPFDTLGADGCIWLRATFPSSGAQCSLTDDRGTRQFFSNNTKNSIQNTVIDTTGAEVGDTVCYFMAIRRFDETKNYTNRDDPTRRVSQPACVTISKSPTFQVKGGDVIAGRAGNGLIRASQVTKRISNVPTTFGSWGEYAVTATGLVEGVSSASGLSGGRQNATICNVAYLTISNAGADTCSSSTTFGGYTNLPGLPSLQTLFTPNREAGSSIDLSDNASGTIYSGSGSIRVSASRTIGLNSNNTGRWIVINAPTANVTITSDILYTNESLRGVRSIPQVVIIANSISVDPSVERIDAWLMAIGEDGRINTCTQVRNMSQLRSTNCNNRLTVHGPVAARTIELRRTAGSDAGVRSGNPAEVFNLRPDSYLWATQIQKNSSRIQTVQTVELPPRY